MRKDKKNGCLMPILVVFAIIGAGSVFGKNRIAVQKSGAPEEENTKTAVTTDPAVDNVTDEKTVTTEPLTTIVQTQTEAPAEVRTETSVVTETVNNEIQENVIRPEIKEAIDIYEAFVDEYVSFMNSFNANSGDMNLLMEYADYIGKMAEFEEKFSKIGDEDMTTAELEYYTQVSLRCSQKMLAAAS